MAEAVTMNRPRWLRVVPGVALIAVIITIAATSWSVLLANKLAYPVTLALSLLLGLWLVLSGLRPRKPARSGPIRGLFRGLAALAGIGLAATLLWLQPFAAEDIALDSLVSDDAVTVTDSRSSIRFEPANPAESPEPPAGFVLYPGARVDPRAYAALASSIATAGHPVVVLKCPFDLALLCAGAAEDYLRADRPWAIGGHSLGGTAASQLAETSTAIDGLIFWASYPLPDLSARTDLAVASIYGSQDGLSTPADIDARRDLLPPDTEYVEVEGTVHSFFGDYGPQPGDGEPTVDRAVAQEQIVDATLEALARAGG